MIDLEGEGSYITTWLKIDNSTINYTLVGLTDYQCNESGQEIEFDTILSA